MYVFTVFMVLETEFYLPAKNKTDCFGVVFVRFISNSIKKVPNTLYERSKDFRLQPLSVPASVWHLIFLSKFECFIWCGTFLACKNGNLQVFFFFNGQKLVKLGQSLLSTQATHWDLCCWKIPQSRTETISISFKWRLEFSLILWSPGCLLGTC